MLSFRPVCSTLPGDEVGTALPYRMNVAAGEYTLTGQNVGLAWGHVLVVGTGSYTLNGQDVEFPISFSAESATRIILQGTTSNRSNHVMIQNFNMVAGDTKTLVVYVKDADGDPVNISGATIKWQAARSHGKASVITKSTSSGITISDGPNGIFSVTLNPSDTESLSGTYAHEAQVTASDSTISTVLQGTMKVNKALIESTAT